MSRAEREAFIADLHVGVIAIDEPGRGPLALPIWYRYVDGDVLIGMDGDSLKARLLQAAGRATMTVQDEQAPYRYVSVEGPVTIEPATDDNHLDTAVRYLGEKLGRRYVEASPIHTGSVIARLRPAHWRTVDYGKPDRA